MARLNPDNETLAHEIIGRYPKKKSALIPLLHLAQEQDGWVTNEAMAHIAELVEVTPNHLRFRKRILDANDRRKATKRARAVALA